MEKRENTDVLIIGSGIAGLYTAYCIMKSRPDIRFRVLEKHKKQWIGGRTGTEQFYGTEVATGAGIGRKNDKLLRKLMRELDFDIREFTNRPEYSRLVDPIDVRQVLNKLREVYQKNHNGASITFEKFAKPVLGETDYKRFLISSGYTDYEKEDAHETLYNYGMEDNACCLVGFAVHWREIILALASKIGNNNISFSQNAVSISGRDGAFSVATDQGKLYHCKKVIVATTITSVRHLFSHIPIYRDIEGQPFLRIYGKFAKASIPLMREYMRKYICVPGHIQKLIAIDPESGVYMIVYSDNKHALHLKDRTENTPDNREFYCRLIERSLGMQRNETLHLIAIRSFFWQVGTHYYPPLDKSKYKTREEFINKAQNPEDGILVVGEVVSKHQGWVEGALESVSAVLDKKWVNGI